MKKHGFAMVFLLILLLSLTGAVSAGDNTACEGSCILESQGEDQMEITACEVFNEDSDVLSQGADTPVSIPDVESCPPDENYELGYEITSDFYNSYDIDQNDDVLVIANSGYFKINNQTTESVLNGIINASNGYITYEDGNLITLSSNSDSMQVIFIAQNDESLTIACYSELNTPLSYGNAGPEISVGQLESLGLNGEVTNFIMSWINGSLDTLNLTTYHKYVSFGLFGEQNTILKLNYYPHEFDLPLAGRNVSRDFSVDAFILKKSDASDEMASSDVAAVGKSMGNSDNLNLEEIGVDAANMAIDYFKLQGISFPEDYPYLYVFTSAGCVKINGLKTDEVIKGLLKVFGSKFNKKHIISVDNPSWKDLVFYFTVVKNTKRVSYALKYDSKSDKLFESAEVRKRGLKIAKKLFSKPERNHLSSKKVILKSVHHDLNRTDNLTLSENKTENVSNVSHDAEKPDEINKSQVNVDVNPFNIIYTLASILIVCVIFGVGYRKR